MALPIFTIQTFNQNTLQPTGAVFAQRVEAVTLGRNFLAGITGATGGRNALMEKKMNDLTKALLDELQIQTKNLFPNAVALVDVKTVFSNIGSEDSTIFLAGQASATALIKRNKSANSSATAPSAPMAPMAPMVPSAPMAPIAPMAPSGPMAPMAPMALVNSKVVSEPAVPLPTTGGKYRSKLGKSRKNRL